MASHKKYVKSLRPVTFITFDSDTLWDQDSKQLVYSEIIPDESENGAPLNGLLHSDSEADRPSYMMGQRSFILNQPTDNYSIVLAPYDKDTVNQFNFAKTWMEIPFEERIRLDKSFTISFLVNKITDDSFVRNWVWNDVTEQYVPVSSSNGYNYNTLKRTIFRKGNKIEMRYNNYWASPDTITFVFPNNSTEISVSNIPGFINRDVYVVMTHDYQLMDDGRYFTTSRVYWDTRIIYEYSTAPVYGDYNGGNTSSFEFGGNQDPWDFNTLNDRATSRTYFDQIAIFDYALKPFQVTDLYKKVYDYETLITRAFPTRYYKFDEDQTDTYFTDSITNDSNYRIYYYGSSTQIQKERPGIHGVYGATSTLVRDKGMLYCKPVVGSTTTNFFNPTGDFTIEFFASFEGSERGVLLSIQDDVQPFRGLCLYVNSRNNVKKSGSIQLSVTENDYIHTPEKDIRNQDIVYNDGVMRHYAIRRTSNFIELWISGLFVDKIYLSAGALTDSTSQLFTHGIMPGNLSSSGNIQHMAVYTRALSQYEIEMRATYMIRYSIEGIITVDGIGQRLLIRVYSFNTGALIVDGWTNSDGSYQIKIPSDDYINFVAMDLSDLNIRPRLIGPILPDEYYDLPFD